MGRVTVEALIENLEDLWAVRRGALPDEQSRRITVTDALVNSGATLLSVPTAIIKQLGLHAVSKKRVTSSVGPTETTLYDTVKLTIQGRSCTMDVIEVTDGVPVLIGQIPLEHLDFVIDMRDQKLIGNPRHGGEHIYEMY